MSDREWWPAAEPEKWVTSVTASSNAGSRGAEPDWPWQELGQSGGSRRRPKRDRGGPAIVLAVVMTLLICGASYAFYRVDPFHLFRPGPQAAEAFPSDAVAYVGVDLDPMAEQKIDALRFLNAFPAFRAHADVPGPRSDVRRVVFDKILESQPCPSVRFATDVAPWLGDRLGVAMMPSTAADSQPYAYALEVSDQHAAGSAVAALERCAKRQSPHATMPGVAYVNGFMLLAPSQRQANAYARQAGRSSLADNDTFQADIGSLGDPGVASAWFDVRALVRSASPQSLHLPQVRAALAAAQRVAATFRFRSDAAEVALSVYGDQVAVAHGYNQVVRLPDSTVFAVSAAGGAARVAPTWRRSLAQLRAQNPAVDREIAGFEARTGLLLPRDLATMLGQNLMLAVDGSGASSASGAAPSGNPSGFADIGARFTNDPAKLNALYRKVLALAGPDAARLGVAKRTFPDGIAVASTAAYANRLGKLDGDLGDTDAFRSVVDDASAKEFVLYVDLDAVKARALSSLRAYGVPADVLDNLRPLRAFGMTADVQGHYEQVDMRLSVDS